MFGAATRPRGGYRVHMLDRVCLEHESRFTPVIPEPMVRSRGQIGPYSAHQQLTDHLSALLDAYNVARRLKTSEGRTPYEGVCNARTAEPERFTRNPDQLTSD